MTVILFYLKFFSAEKSNFSFKIFILPPGAAALLTPPPPTSAPGPDKPES
jgi:hypothetical protein